MKYLLFLLAIVSQENTVKIVTFGDSTTAERSTVDRVYAQHLNEIPGFVVVNAGVPGNTTALALTRFEKDVVAADPDLVVIQFGLNDSCIDVHKGRTGPRVAQNRYEEHLVRFVRALKAKGVKVILMTPNPMLWTDELLAKYGRPPYDPDDPLGFNVLNKDYAESVRRIARINEVPLVDVHRYFLDYDRVEGQSASDLLLDGIHPNDLGHRVIAQWLEAKIELMFEADQGPAVDTLPLASPRYTLPVVDLAMRKDMQTVVDREEGQYLGHPTTVLLEDGKTMICVYPKGHGKGAIMMKRSTDGGRTWSERLPTPESWATSKETPTIHRVINKQGKKRLILFSGLYPIRMAVSDDDGLTWSELEPIGDYGGIVTMGCVERLASGDYMALFHDDGRFFRESGKRTEKMHVYKVLSRDGGLTWSEPVVIATHEKAHLCEPGLIRSPDGKQIAVLLRENSRTMNSFVIFSNDEGETWTRPRELPAALTGDRHTGKYAPDDRLFISFRDTARVSGTQGDWAGWVGTYEDIVHGREGQYRVRIMDNHHRWDCAYPGVEVLPDGTFVTTTYGHWIPGEPPYVVSVRFKLEELDALPKQQDLFYMGMNGVHQYRIPSMAVTKNGVVLAVCDARVDRTGDLPNNIDQVIRRSLDHGATWEPARTIVDYPGNQGGGDPCMVVDRITGTVWLFYVYGDEGIGLWTSKPGVDKDTMHVYTMKSDDDGLTWSEPRDLTKDLKDPAWHAIWQGPGCGIQTREGRLLVPCSVWYGQREDHTHLIYSDDHGETWGFLPAAGSGTNEAQLVELADGTLLINMRSLHKKNLRAVAHSADSGQTWSELKHHEDLIEPTCQASLIRYTLKDGLVFANPASTKRECMTVKLSFDDGRTWPFSKMIHKGPAAYSSLAQLPDGSIGLLYEQGEENPYQKISFVKFTIEWLMGDHE